MVSVTYTVSFTGIDAQLVEVQCALSAGVPAFAIVGLPDKAVSEARERIRAALSHLAITLPAKRITVNLSPADLPKEGSHFDLPIALALLAAMDVLSPEDIARHVSMGELSLSGQLVAITGILPAAVTAAAEGRSLICPAACAAEGAWVTAAEVIGAPSLSAVIKHLKGQSEIAPAALPTPETAPARRLRDLEEVKGQDRARRALEIAAAGQHHLLMIGPPGAGKSLLAECLAGILPPLSPQEALETSMVHSVAGMLRHGALCFERPFRKPHHTASRAALVGGGRKASPGEVSLAHNGVLFLDELPEFDRSVLETLRQPVETGEITIARASTHTSYPSRFMLIAAANPCPCGHAGDADRACPRAPACGHAYLSRVSGPLFDRFDMSLQVAALTPQQLRQSQSGESSHSVAARVRVAHQRQLDRFAAYGWAHAGATPANAHADGAWLNEIANLDPQGQSLLDRAVDKFNLTGRSYNRCLRVARTIADLEGVDCIASHHIAEAVSFRLRTLVAS